MRIEKERGRLGSRLDASHSSFLTHQIGARRTIARVESGVAAVLGRLPFAPGDLFLVALSGGSDSVATLYALKSIRDRSRRYRLAAAHLNHDLRGPESDRDETFVRELCDHLGVELMVERAQGLKSPNLEERARETRYEFLNRAADALQARFIMLGHHADDQAETVLLRLLRGTGIAGLSAMAECGPGRLVRPMLSLGRATILAYLAAIGADYIIDSSNLEGGALRNRVRRTLLPELERQYAPGIARRLVELASEVREFDSFIAAEARRALEARLVTPSVDLAESASSRVNVRGFASINPALGRAIMRELLRRCIGDLRRIERVHINAMRSLAVSENPSAGVVLPRGWRFRREYDTAVLERSATQAKGCATSAPEPFAVKLMAGENVIEGSGLTLSLKVMAVGEPCFPPEPWHPPSSSEAYFDAAAAPELAARSFQPGDRIKPLGMRGSRKVHDVFVDRKVAVVNRGLWPLVVSGDEVLWIPGLARSRTALVTSLSKKILHLRADLLPGERNVRLLGL